MKYGLYVIYDKIAKDSGFPFDAKNDGIALRKMHSFLAQVTKDGTASESEFELRKVCLFDSESSQISEVTLQVVSPLPAAEKKEE